MDKINVKMLSEDALSYLKRNAESFSKKIIATEEISQIINEIPKPVFIEKKISIENFDLVDNPDSSNKEEDFNNSVTIYENLKHLPRYVLCDQRFWLWLHLDKYYKIVRKMMKITGKSTFNNHWLHSYGTRRGLMFGVLSRCYFRVALTVDEKSKNNKYELTRWIIDNPERFRNLTWRSFSSEKHLVRGILKGEKRAIDENPDKESNKLYPAIAKYVLIIGSARLLDSISEEDMEQMIYDKMIEYMNSGDY